jgi:hypothetical protein
VVGEEGVGDEDLDGAVARAAEERGEVGEPR